MVNATKPPTKRFGRIPGIDNFSVIGLDFSGAALSGKTAWLAEMAPRAPAAAEGEQTRFRLDSLRPLGKLAGGDERDTVNRYLVDRISSSRKTLWGCDFPFGLPVGLRLGGWPEQLRKVQAFSGNAKEYGLSLVERTERLFGSKHHRRVTDRETQTPFDCYHYRIIYQTFHGMRDVLANVTRSPGVIVLPFEYDKLPSRADTIGSVVVEACPASTLKRVGLPHQKYKQSGGKPPERIHRRRRRQILDWVSEFVEISSHRRCVIMRDPGGDALDAVLAGLGAWQGMASASHPSIASHRSYPREGYVYC